MVGESCYPDNCPSSREDSLSTVVGTDSQFVQQQRVRRVHLLGQLETLFREFEIVQMEMFHSDANVREV